MKAMLLKTFLCLGAMVLPTLAQAAAGVFDVAPTDKSMQYLGMIFGPMGSLPITAEENSTFSNLVYIFNQTIFALGIIIVIYTSFMGVINTAQEGEVLGKKWSSIIIPFRAGLGVYLLIPATGGYNWIQMGVMWFIIQGVGAANALWEEVIVNVSKEANIHEDTRKADLKNAMVPVVALFDGTMCMDLLNGDTLALAELKEPISMYRFEDSIEFGRMSKAGKEAALCGSIKLPDVVDKATAKKNEPDLEARKDMLEDSLKQAHSAIVPSVIEALTINPDNWALFDNFVLSARALKAGVMALTTTFKSLSERSEDAITDGWIHAGSYYFKIAEGGNVKKIHVSFEVTEMNSDQLKKELGSSHWQTIYNHILNEGMDYKEAVTDAIKTLDASDRQGGEMVVTQPSGMKGPFQDIMDKTFGRFFNEMVSEFWEITSTFAGDPIVSLATFGGTLAISCELLFWGTIMTVIGVWIYTLPMSCIMPIGHALNFVLVIFLPIFTLIIMIFWAAGMAMGLYIPLIPYFVFTFGAIAWIILIIETLLAAPLIALTLIVPSEDEIGKAGHAMIILLGVFLRPALMILGFILAIKLLIVAFGMLNFAFGATLARSISMSTGFFAFIALIIMYSGIAVALVHEACSLIWLLPDKVLRWMGGTPESTGDIGEKARKLEASSERGIGMGKGAMKAGMSTAESTAKAGTGIM